MQVIKITTLRELTEAVYKDNLYAISPHPIFLGNRFLCRHFSCCFPFSGKKLTSP